MVGLYVSKRIYDTGCIPNVEQRFLKKDKLSNIKIIIYDSNEET